MHADTRGVSEALGFAFIFAMVVLSITLVSATGYAGLVHVRDTERVNNVENAFDVLDNNVDDLVYHGAPSRSTEIQLDEASLSIGEPITVRVRGTSATGPNFDETYQVRSLVYDGDTGTGLVYVNGVVIREDRTGMVVLREPDLLVSTEETALTIVDLSQAGDTRSVGGSTTVTVRTTRNEADVVVAETVPYVVTYEITSPHADAWERAMEEVVTGGCTRTGETVSCTWSTDRVYVTVVETDVRFD